jgi:tetratricopeptide (TPR) repeat protein
MSRALFLFVGLILLAGCAITGPPLPKPLPGHIPDRAHLADVPFHEQAALHCGPAALAMVLQWSAVAVGPDDLVAQVFTPGRQGSLQSELISAARRHGRLAYPIYGMGCLLEAVAAGMPVVVFQNLGLGWLPRWHYAVAVGYDLVRDEVILHTGRHADRRVGRAVFERTWRRAGHWALLVLPPGEIPACADEQPYLQAALGLQHAGRPDAAQTAFEAATRQWPQSVAARMALGNTLYGAGQTAAAAAAFRMATQMDAGNAAAFNNLAHVLAEQGLLAEAEAAARHAVQLGGSHQAISRQTLEEIRQRAAAKP